MQSPGRASAAIEVLDRILGGEAAEKALTAWARGARFAGSKDRAAVRDLVFEALRKRRTAAALAGLGGEVAPNGRALILGVLRDRGENLDQWFDGSTHAPKAPSADEVPVALDGAAAHDIPDWLDAPLRRALGEDFAPVMAAMRARAPAILRTNIARTTPEALMRMLAAEGIEARPHPLAKAALEIGEGARKLTNSQAHGAGLFEMQDAASQALVEALPLADGMKVLDHCAGGGGKTLAMGAMADLALYAHDAQPRRMEELKTRAARAGLEVTLTDAPEKAAPFDLILTDVPCSGSGSWRRDPEGKWRLTPARLQELCAIQAEILTRCAKMVRADGYLAYATCSFLREEDEDQVEAFLAAHPEFKEVSRQRFSPLDGGDGFFMALLRRVN